MDNKERKYGLIQAPDGFYIGRILKSGMISKDSRKISEQEIITMFEDLLRRNKAETGRSVLSLFSHGKPVMVAKIDPDIRECGVLPQMKAALAQKAQMQQKGQQQGLRLSVPK